MRSTILLLLVCCLPTIVEAANPMDSGKKPVTKPVVVTGELETGLMAIGGEAAGTQVKSHGRIYELEFTTHPELRKVADGLNGRRVTATGPLRKVTGVERKDRWVIDVEELKGEGEKFTSTHMKVAEPKMTDAGNGMLYVALPGKADTKVTLQFVPGELGVEIRAASGIGTVTVTRNMEQWPEKIALNLYLHGLEFCKVSAGEHELGWSVASTQPLAFRTWQIAEGKEQNLSPGHAMYSPVSGHGIFRDRDMADPVLREKFASMDRVNGRDNQRFVIRVPEAILAGNPKSFEIQFIDFYR